jgi:hypothetical protein
LQIKLQVRGASPASDGILLIFDKGAIFLLTKLLREPFVRSQEQGAALCAQVERFISAPRAFVEVRVKRVGGLGG